MQTSLHVIASAAARNKTKRFRSLYSLLNRVVLEKAYYTLNKDAACGVDQMTWKEYGKDLQRNLIALEERLKQKRYWPRFVKRVTIPKGNGKMRLLGVPAVEDKIVQQVLSEILNALFEPLFLPGSYAYRPERSAKQAVEELREEIGNKYAWVVEADIKGFFDNINHDWLIKMVASRVNDSAFTGLIMRFLKAGIMTQEGTIELPEKGTPQGSIISPVLSNIYLHYVLDWWFKTKIKKTCKAEAVLVRYADDFVAAFRLHAEAKLFYKQLAERLRKFSLEVCKEKTRILPFNRFNKERSKSFVFLGYEFRWIVARRNGRDVITTKMSRKRLSRTANEFSKWCKENRNRRIAWIMGMVKSKLRGIKGYFNLPGNSLRIRELETLFKRILYRHLNRRSERRSYNLKTFTHMWNYFFGKSRKQLVNTGIQLSFINMLL